VSLVLVACQTPDLGQKDPEKATKVRTQLAVEYLRTGDLDAAKRALDQALETTPRDSQANMMMGVLLQQEGSKLNLEKADHYFKRAISADPKNAQARNNYGTYLYQLERYNDAIEQFQIAGATLGYDQRFRALENMGRIYLKLGDTANAEKSFKQAASQSRFLYFNVRVGRNILFEPAVPGCDTNVSTVCTWCGTEKSGCPCTLDWHSHCACRR